MKGAQVQVLVGELRSHMLHNVAKKKKKEEWINDKTNNESFYSVFLRLSYF